ncbi:unnamed protein product [Cuscuta campestris]|uniref:non-specific serine/threonine protein kinase n=1 Tax=Cuscuta campestris TaxID=132261 RepID=A0A484ME18_9ASTE|nr:unnamed protein product [Cuscuta campestris]
MLVVSFLSLLSHYSFICFWCFIISTPPVHGDGGREFDRFLRCNSTRYNCGGIRDVGYPFWGKDRPEECGHPSFHLRCNDIRNETTIAIDSLSFRVIEIDKPSLYTMKIARTDFLNHECPPIGTGLTASDGGGAFSFFPDVVNATLHIGNCRFPPDYRNLEYSKLVFECHRGDHRGDVRNVTVSFPSSDSDGVTCDDDGEAYVMRVPVSKLGLFDELEKNETSTNALDVLNQGITMWYNGSIEYCLACEASDGECWMNTSSPKPTCLCPDGISPYFCGYGDPGRRTTKLFIGLVAGAVGALLISAVFFYCKIKPLRRKTEHFKTAAINRDIEAFIKGHGPLALTRYRFAEIKKMTNSFEVKLGQGGYGKVYKGKLPDGHLVAVKLLTLSKGNGEDFINEVASISRTSHVNIVNLLGFCLEGHKRILVYEFMPSGSLDKFINNNVSHNSLSWENLYQIALGTARGLEYLHKGCNTRILHFDIKPHNILLDENFCPKISDFGLAKLCLNKESIISISQARGTVGYLAPEIWNRNFGGISHKSDVYSYGMMLIDMVGGRNNTNVETKSASENYFPDWIYNKLEQDCSLESNGTNNIDENDVAMRMTIVGLWCIQTFPSHRPTIGRVIEMLEGNLSALEIPPKPILSSPPRLQCEFSSTTKTTSTTAFISDPNSGKHQSEARTSIAC